MHVRRIPNEESLHEVEVMLFIECMKKEVETASWIWEPFELRVARELSNDFGEQMIAEMGFLLV